MVPVARLFKDDIATLRYVVPAGTSSEKYFLTLAWAGTVTWVSGLIAVATGGATVKGRVSRLIAPVLSVVVNVML
jgi:hypothetical protein